MTKLEAVNKFVLQWFFIRLARVEARGTGKLLGYGILGFPLPLTGWRSRYIWLRRGWDGFDPRLVVWRRR